MMLTPFKAVSPQFKTSRGQTNNHGEPAIGNVQPKNQSANLRSQFLQSKLGIKQKKLQSLQQKLAQQSDKIHLLQKTIVDKQIEIVNKNEGLQKLQKKNRQLEAQVSKYVDILEGKNRQIKKMDLQLIKDRQQNSYQDKITKMMVSQNNQLISQKSVLQQTIAQLTQKLQRKQAQMQAHQQNNTLLLQLNQTLKLQIEQLLFEVRMLNRKMQTTNLNDYEGDIDSRMGLIGKYKNNSKLEGFGEGLAFKKEAELVALLKMKISSLQQQLEVSEKRCRQLQAIVLKQ